MGRTLPNMFALFPVNIASALLLSRPPNSLKPSSTNVYTAIALLTSTAVIFRAELVLLLAPLVLQCLILKYVPFGGVVKLGMIVGLVSTGEFQSMSTKYFSNSACSRNHGRRLILLEDGLLPGAIGSLFQRISREEL